LREGKRGRHLPREAGFKPAPMHLAIYALPCLLTVQATFFLCIAQFVAIAAVK
jgi:hypothetical protein